MLDLMRIRDPVIRLACCLFSFARCANGRESRAAEDEAGSNNEQLTLSIPMRVI